MKKQLPIIIVAFVILGGIGLAANNNNKNNQAKKDEIVAMEKKKADEATAMAKEKAMKATETEAMKKEAGSTTNPDGTVMVKHGDYITLADYNADKAKYADNKKVLFFHAPWCPNCQALEKEINADINKIPAGVTIIKTDYDSNISLKQKYGVTIQHTFVQIDNNENKLAKWTATGLNNVIAGIKS